MTYPAPTLSTWSSQDECFSLPSCASSFPGSGFSFCDFLQEDCNSISGFCHRQASLRRLLSQKPAASCQAPSFLPLVLSSPCLLVQVCLTLQLHVSRFPQRQGKEQTVEVSLVCLDHFLKSRLSGICTQRPRPLRTELIYPHPRLQVNPPSLFPSMGEWQDPSLHQALV